MLLTENSHAVGQVVQALGVRSDALSGGLCEAGLPFLQCSEAVPCEHDDSVLCQEVIGITTPSSEWLDANAKPTLTSQLWTIPSVKHVNLVHANLHGEVPAELASMQLETLLLADNALQCPVADYSTWAVHNDFNTYAPRGYGGGCVFGQPRFELFAVDNTTANVTVASTNMPTGVPTEAFTEEHTRPATGCEPCNTVNKQSIDGCAYVPPNSNGVVCFSSWTMPDNTINNYQECHQFFQDDSPVFCPGTDTALPTAVSTSLPTATAAPTSIMTACPDCTVPATDPLDSSLLDLTAAFGSTSLPLRPAFIPSVQQTHEVWLDSFDAADGRRFTFNATVPSLGARMASEVSAVVAADPNYSDLTFMFSAEGNTSTSFLWSLLVNRGTLNAATYPVQIVHTVKLGGDPLATSLVTVNVVAVPAAQPGNDAEIIIQMAMDPADAPDGATLQDFETALLNEIRALTETSSDRAELRITLVSVNGQSISANTDRQQPAAGETTVTVAVTLDVLSAGDDASVTPLAPNLVAWKMKRSFDNALFSSTTSPYLFAAAAVTTDDQFNVDTYGPTEAPVQPTAADDSSSIWWIVFPIVGGVAVIGFVVMVMRKKKQEDNKERDDIEKFKSANFNAFHMDNVTPADVEMADYSEPSSSASQSHSDGGAPAGVLTHDKEPSESGSYSAGSRSRSGSGSRSASGSDSHTRSGSGSYSQSYSGSGSRSYSGSGSRSDSHSRD